MSDAPAVVLIRPPKLIAKAGVNTNSVSPPLNVAYLAAALRSAGHSVTTLDCPGMAIEKFTPLEDLPYLVQGATPEDIVGKIPADVRVIGVSCMFSREWYYHLGFIASLRRAFPSALIVAGGEHITAEPEVCLRRCPDLDVCVVGEGEATLVAIADAVAAGRSIDDLPGTVIRLSDRSIRNNGKRPRIKKVDTLAWPDWTGIPLDAYFAHGGAMDEQVKRTIPMLASRGCPYKCTFCSNPNMWGVTWVARDPDDIVNEIAHYKRTYDVEHVEFYDLTMVLDRRWVARFGQALASAGLKVSWAMPPGTRSEALDRDLLRLMARSGCAGITYAPESGSPETLVQIKKRVNLDKMLGSIATAVDERMYVKASIIYGLPGQTLADGMKTIGLAVRLAWIGVNDVLVFPFNPYPGSEIYANLVAQGKITPDAPDHARKLLTADYGDTSAVRSWSDDLSATSILFVSAATMGLFYSLQFLVRPLRAAPAIGRIVRRKPATWLERALVGQMRKRAARYWTAAS